MMTGLFVFLALALAGPAPGSVASTPSVGGVHWLENKGQWPAELRYGGWTGPVWVAVRSDGVDFHVSEVQGGRTQVVTLRFEGVAADGVRGLDPEPGLFHDYHGPESQWIRGVRSFGRVELARPSAGESIVLGLEGDSLQIEVRHIGSSMPDPLRVRVLGADRLSVLPDGGVSIQTPLGVVRLALPTFVPGGLAHSSLAELHEGGRVIWRAGPPFEGGLPAQALTAGPPELLWSTLWGGVPTISSNLGDAAEDVFVDDSGNVTVVGTVAGVDYLLTPGSFHTEERNDDLFVARFRQGTGELVYSARVGSTSRDDGQAVAVDAKGRATVVGTVGQNAQGFPTTPNAYDPVKSQFDDAAVVFRLSPLGDQLEYSTYLEGTGSSHGYGVALAQSGSAVVVGYTLGGFPTTSGAYSTFKGGIDTFVTRLDPTGSTLEFSTLIGGIDVEVPVAVRLDAQEFVYLAGETAFDFPTTPGAHKSKWSGVGTDAFVCCLDPTGSTLLWSTLLGGTNTETDGDLALAPNGDVIVTGTTSSTDFPTTPGALQETASGAPDAYVARIGSSGTQLVYASYLGGSGFDNGRSIAVDRSGLVTVVGSAGKDVGFPLTPGAFKTAGSSDAFLTILRPDGGGPLYSTLLGAGAGFDDGLSLGVRPDGLATMGGRVNPSFGTGGPFPTTPGALVPTYLGSMDSFVTTFHPLLQGVQLLGSSSPSCLGPLKANAATLPLAGQPFSLYCSQAPPGAQGLLLTFTGEGLASFQLVQSDPNGFVETQVGTLPNQPGALRRYRYAFLNTPTCAGPAAFTYSNLVLVQIQ